MTNETRTPLTNYNLAINGIARDNLITLANTVRPLISDDDPDTLEALDYFTDLLIDASPGPAVNGVTAFDLADTLRDSADAVDDAYNLASTTYYRMAEDAIEVIKNGL